MSTPSIFGFLSGIGSRQRYYSQLEHDEQLHSERTKNEGTAKMLESLLNREDVPIETKNAAAKGLLDFSKIPGTPNAKHRSSVLDPVLASLNTPREAPMAMIAHQRADEALSTPPESDAEGLTPINPSVRAATWNAAAKNVPQRSGLMTADEIALRRGNAFGIMRNAMGGANQSGDDSYYDEVPQLDAKGQMTIKPMRHQRSGVEADYLDELNQPQHGFVRIDYSTGQAVSAETGRPVRIVSRTVSNNVTPVTSAGGLTGSQTTYAPKFGTDVNGGGVRGTTVPRPVPMRMLPTEDVEGNIGAVGINPITGKQGTAVIPRGRKANSDVRRESVATGNIVKQGTYKATVDPTAFPSVPTPPGLPTLHNDEGEDVPVGTKVYTATKEPGSVLQRASSGRSIVAQGKDVAAKVEDPANADLFGKIQGRISQMMVRGPHGVIGLKWVGPIGTDDPRLSDVYAGLKSISDLLTTVHGRRAEQSAQDFFDTMQMVNSPQALAAAIRQYVHVAQQIAGEGSKPTTKVQLPKSSGKGKGKNSTAVDDETKAALRALAAKLSGTVPTRTPQPTPQP